MLEPTGNPGAVAMTSPWMPDMESDVLWAFFASAPVALLAADDDRKIVRVNDCWCELTGHDTETTHPHRSDDVLAPESRPGIEMRWRDLLATGLSTARIVLLRPDGARLPVRYGA